MKMDIGKKQCRLSRPMPSGEEHEEAVVAEVTRKWRGSAWFAEPQGNQASAPCESFDDGGRRREDAIDPS